MSSPGAAGSSDVEEGSPAAKKIKEEEEDVGEEEDEYEEEEEEEGLIPPPPPTSEKPTTTTPVVVPKSKEQLEEEEREKMLVLVSNFTEDQLDRYELFRRAALPKATVKRVMQNITATSVGQNVVIAMAGIAKVFVGEVIEEALDALEKSCGANDPGLLKPKDLREAVRRVRRRGGMPKSKKNSPFI